MADISVIGAGLTGLAFAIAARRHGYAVDVYDRRAAPVMPADESANVLAMNEASTTFLSDIGVFGQIPSPFRPAYTQMQVFDAEGTGSVSFDAEDAGLSCLGHIVDQRAAVAALAACAGAAGVDLHWESSVDPQALAGELLVAADGAHSETREKLGFRKLRYAYDQSATVCVARLPRGHDACAWQWFHADGPLALLPLSEPDKVAVVWSSSTDRSGLDDEAFRQALAGATEEHMGGVESVGPRFSFPLMQLQVFRYVAPGVALLGDAAHAIHPLAGQGANLGLADAAALAAEIGAARIEGRSPGDIHLLKRYERSRRLHNQLAGAAMEGFYRLFSVRQPLLGTLRSQGMRFVQENVLLKRMAINIASGHV